MERNETINQTKTVNDIDKLFMMTLDTFIFTKRIIQHKENNNKINKSLASNLYTAMCEIESFLNNAEIDEEALDVDYLEDIMPSIDSSVLQEHHYYHCKACNHSVKSSRNALHEHFSSNKHLKNLRILSVNMNKHDSQKLVLFKQQSENRKAVPGDANYQERSTHSLNNIVENQISQKTVVKREPLNSFPAKIRDVYPKENLSKKMQEFLVKIDLDSFTSTLVREGQIIQKSSKHIRVCDLLRKRLIGCFPNIQIYPFGSFITGLGQNVTDLDIFVDTNKCFYSKLSKRKMKDAIFQTQRILSNFQDWDNFEPIVHARTPILRVYCKLESIDCDLSFSNGLSTANTALISYLTSLQPISKKIILFVKFWANNLNLGTNSYLITLMVIFYLQQEKLIPPVKLLQDGSPPIQIDMWNTAFATPNLKQLNVPLATDLRRYLIGFFLFYGYEFDFTNYVICILTGDRVPKQLFDHGKEHLLPPVFRSFFVYMSKINLEEADEVEDLFANYKPLVIQDPFDLVHNVAKGIQETKLIKIIHFMRCTHGLLTNGNT